MGNTILKVIVSIIVFFMIVSMTEKYPPSTKSVRLFQSTILVNRKAATFHLFLLYPFFIVLSRGRAEKKSNWPYPRQAKKTARNVLSFLI